MNDVRKMGRVTIPTDMDAVPETLDLLKRWGADAIRDCDGTEFPQELKDTGAKIYATYYTTRKDNAWAKANPDETQQCYIMTPFYTAEGGALTIPLMTGISRELMKVNDHDDIARWWEVMDRTTGEPVPTSDWCYDTAAESVVIDAPAAYHEYTVSFLAYLIWDPVHMYNSVINDWKDVEHQIPFDVRQPKTHAYTMRRLREYLETMTATNSASIAKSSVIINGQNVPYTSVPDLIPDDITWEKVTTYNIGLDLDLFNNRLSFTGDYYRRNTTDLYTVGPNLPQVLGSAAPYGNYASLKTKGWEVSLGWRDSFKLGGKPFNYSLRAMLWDSRSWITDYYNETGDLTTYYKGMEIGEIWGFRTAGIYASNAEALNGPAYNFFKNGEMFRAYAGDLRFVDVDGDGIMTKGNRTLSNHGDMEIIGNQSPRYQYSINMSLNWNGIGLSMLWQGVGKRDWYPWTESGFFWGKWNRAYNSLMKTQTGDRVVKIDKSTDNWRVTNMDKNPYWTRMVSLAANRNDGPLTWENDHYLQDASYIRLKNITVDYTFPKHICKKLRIEGLKIYVSGENLFTHSPMFKYTDMFDPEVITSGDSDFASTQKSGLGGTGNGYSYPMLKTVTLGVNVTF